MSTADELAAMIGVYNVQMKVYEMHVQMYIAKINAFNTQLNGGVHVVAEGCTFDDREALKLFYNELLLNCGYAWVSLMLKGEEITPRERAGVHIKNYIIHLTKPGPTFKCVGEVKADGCIIATREEEGPQVMLVFREPVTAMDANITVVGNYNFFGNPT